MSKIGFRAGIHILIKKDGKYLLIRRALTDPDDPGAWDLPGGGINYLEKPLTAALREAKEEAGVDIKVKRIIDLWAKQYRGDWSIESLVEGEWVKGEVTLSNEHSEHRWVSRQELKSINPRSDNLKALFKVNETLLNPLRHEN